MIKKLLSWSARRSHDVRVQAPFALMVGLLEVFGLGPSVLIIYHLWKMGRSKLPQKPLFPKLVKAIMFGVPLLTFYIGAILGHYLTYFHVGIVAMVVNVVYVVVVNYSPRRKHAMQR
jgi:hypothetical protein